MRYGTRWDFEGLML
jgi:hypothetical protein